MMELLLSYLIGSIPFGYIISKALGVNIRKIGSGNIGATNVYRALGIKVALVVGLLDIAKGFLPAYLWGMEAGVFAVLGNIFSLFLLFKGGKGVSSSLGFAIAMALRGGYWHPLISALIIWFLVFYLNRIVSLASLSALTTFALTSYGTDLFPYAVIIALAVFYAHRSNIRRLIKGEEKRLRRVEA